ncbi:MAG TPA: NADH-quinone oxidoreductase subunit J [Fimbriiglobus sp.]
MPLFAEPPTTSSASQVVLACAMGAAGIFLLLPRPSGRKVALGTFLALAGLGVMATFMLDAFGKPEKDDVGTWLFYLFATGAVGFAGVLVAQRNPARGAIAFAFVVLNVCGLFVLLAAPFLAAASVVVYAGAIIVTFLFVLMLSHARGHSPENDRTREPLLGTLAAFAFIGLVLFGLYESRPEYPFDVSVKVIDGVGHEATAISPVPTLPLTPHDKLALEQIARKLADVADGDYTTAKQFVDATESIRVELGGVLGGIDGRYRYLPRDRSDIPPPGTWALDRARDVERKSKAVENALTRSPNDARQAVRQLREAVLLLRGSSELPARNVANLGYLLYSEHLLAVELAGTLLLVATIGAVAIAGRKAVPA